MPSCINNVELKPPFPGRCFTPPATYLAPSTMELSIKSDGVAWSRVEGDVVILALSREICRDNSRTLRDRILDLIGRHSPRRLVLDLEQVPWMDSTACAMLIEALRRMRALGGEVCLTALQPAVKGILEIARLISLFTVISNETEMAAAK